MPIVRGERALPSIVTVAVVPESRRNSRIRSSGADAVRLGDLAMLRRDHLHLGVRSYDGLPVLVALITAGHRDETLAEVLYGGGSAEPLCRRPMLEPRLIERGPGSHVLFGAATRLVVALLPRLHAVDESRCNVPDPDVTPTPK